MRVAILRDNKPESSLKWEIACRKMNVRSLSINMLVNDWLALIMKFNPDFCVSRPPGDIQLHKKIFDEKLYFLEKYTSFRIYPGFSEIYIYENKAALEWFLRINDIPHPLTLVTSIKEESMKWIRNAKFPIVFKTLIGASGTGVHIIDNIKEAEEYLEKVFSEGIRRRYGPNPNAGNPKTWTVKAVRSPGYFFKKLKQYNERVRDVQKDIVVIQEYIEHNFEWRCVRIGESYFAYKKLKLKGKASGSKLFEYGPPPFELLDFTKNLCEKFNFQFMAVDLFHNPNGIFVNELQTIFGHKNPYICKVNDVPGRYVNQSGMWQFEAGDFNTNESYDLRLSTALELFNRSVR